MGIRWRPKDIHKLSTYVGKFNAAITRLEKKYPELKDSGVFPERLSVQDLKYRILNRNDFNRELRKIDRLFKKGAQEVIKDESGYFTTKWQRKELKLLERRINAQRKAFVEKYSIPRKEKEFLGVDQINLSKKKKSIVSKAMRAEPEDAENIMQEWYNLIYNLERQSSEEYLTGTFEKLKNAYFKAIDDHLPEDRAEELKKYLKDNNIYGSDIVYAISINDILDFEYFYSTEQEDQKAEVLLDRWKQIMPKIKESPNYKRKV